MRFISMWLSGADAARRSRYLPHQLVVTPNDSNRRAVALSPCELSGNSPLSEMRD